MCNSAQIQSRKCTAMMLCSIANCRTIALDKRNALSDGPAIGI
jgi:hypothetical protein